MHYLNLKDLPPPPPGKRGWPWTKESPPLPPTMPNGEPWPKISIVTPSFNQGQFIEETIRSVLLQNYPNLEYIIIDGGSTDNSVEIIKKYEPWLTYWISEQDRGQSHAINKGFERCSGKILNWLCSDDIFLSETFEQVALNIDFKNPCWLIGSAYRYDEKSKTTSKKLPILSFDITNLLLWFSRSIAQPSVFWNDLLYSTVKNLNEDLMYCMDIDLWFDFYQKKKPIIYDGYLSQYRHHSLGKTSPYSCHCDNHLNEYVNWLLEKLYKCKDEEISYQVKKGIIFMQEECKYFQKIKNHIVLGKILKIWKLLINNKLFVG